MKLGAEIHHGQYGSAVFSRPNLVIEVACTHITEGQMETITVALSNVSVSSVYKPPQGLFLHPELPDFYSARWKRGYNPDLVCVSSELTSRVVKSVLDPIPHTQHRHITITIQSVLHATNVPFGKRFNLRRADWLSFQQEIENSIPSNPSHPNNYNMFIDLLKRSARRHIPRGCQTEYIPGLSETSSDLLKAYHGAYHEDPFSLITMELGETLLKQVWKD